MSPKSSPEGRPRRAASRGTPSEGPAAEHPARTPAAAAPSSGSAGGSAGGGDTTADSGAAGGERAILEQVAADPHTIGWRVRKARLEFGAARGAFCSQTELADLVERVLGETFDQSRLSRIENDATTGAEPTRREIVAIALVTGRAAAWLFFGDDIDLTEAHHRTHQLIQQRGASPLASPPAAAAPPPPPSARRARG